MRYEIPISTLPYFISNGFENIVSSSTSNKILALNLLNLLYILIKVFNMSFLAQSNDLSKKLLSKGLSIMGILYF